MNALKQPSSALRPFNWVAAAFSRVATPAKKLKIGQFVAPASGNWGDVVNLQPINLMA